VICVVGGTGTVGRALLDELAATLASQPTDRTKHREEVYRLLGACRFGFAEALAAWHDNTAARAGVLRATVAVAEYELASGDPASAAALLAELDDPPPLLEKAREAAASAQTRRAHLEELDHAHDLEVGRLTRGRLGITLGVLFTIAPLVAQWVPMFQSHAWYILWSTVAMTITAGWSWFARDSIGTTLVNRRLVLGAVFVFATQALLVSIMWWLGADLGYTEIAMMFLYMITTGMMAITVDRALWLSSVGFAIGVLAAVPTHRHGLYIMSGTDFVFTLNILIYWRLAKPLHAASR
jgi:hypothetical protein